MKEKEKERKKSFKKRLFLYISEVTLAILFIYQSLEREVGGLVKEFNPLVFGIGIALIIMNLAFIYMEWKVYKRS